MIAQGFNAAARPVTAAQRQQGEELLAAIARQKPDVDDIRFLITSGASLKETDRNGNSALMATITWGNQPLIELMLRHGADINHQNHRGDTALHRLAAAGGPTATFLVERGADALLPNKEGKTPYDIARRWAQNPLLPLLAEKAAAARALRETSIRKKLTVAKAFKPLKAVRFKAEGRKAR